jgi:hypothetical protein
MPVRLPTEALLRVSDQAGRIVRSETSLAGNRSAGDGCDELVELPERPFR